MKIAIIRQGDNIRTIKDYSDIQDKGEVSHIYLELQLIQEDLLNMWEEINEAEEPV